MKRTTKIAAELLIFILAVAFAAPSFVLGETPTEEGPADLPKFENWAVVGPDGGDVRSITIDPRDPNRLYLSTLDGQIYTSADGAKNWRLLVNLNEPELILDNLFVDSRDSRIIYASGHRHKNPGGFFRSTDGGVTWKASKELKGEAVHALVQSTFDANYLFAGTTNGVWVSKNSGESWDRLSSTTNPINVDSIAIDPRGTNTIYAGTWWRAYKSTDSGKSWRLIKDGMIDDSDVFAVDIDPRNPEHIISSACSGIYESVNGGEKWAKIQGIPSQSRRTRDIMQHPTMPGTIFAATTEGFWMSSNSGKAWSLTTQRNLEINSIALHPDIPNRVFIATNNYGVMVSNDGGKNFTPTNDRFTSRFTYNVMPDLQQPNRLYAATRNIATGGGFLFVSTDGGANWKASSSIDVNRISPFALRQDRVTPNVMYLGTNVGIYRSMDRGITWAPIPAGKVPVQTVKTTVRRKGKNIVKTVSVPKGITQIKEKVKIIEFTEDGKNGLIAGTDKGLYRSYNFAQGWEKIDLGGNNDNIFSIHTSPLRPETIWVGTATSGVIVSHDSGKTWAKVAPTSDGSPVSSIASDPKDPDRIYVGTGQTFYISRDGGTTWKRRGGGLPIGSYTSILIDPDRTDEVIVSSSLEKGGGIYISTDGGDKWKRMDDKDWNLPSRRVWALAFDPRDPNRIYAGTHSSGVYRIERGTQSAGGSADRPRIASAP